MMDDYVNKNLIVFKEKNDIGIDEDGGETKDIENEDIIHKKYYSK